MPFLTCAYVGGADAGAVYDGGVSSAVCVGGGEPGGELALCVADADAW